MTDTRKRAYQPHCAFLPGIFACKARFYINQDYRYCRGFKVHGSRAGGDGLIPGQKLGWGQFMMETRFGGMGKGLNTVACLSRLVSFLLYVYMNHVAG